MPVAEATALMADARGSHFDPDVIDIFMSSVPVPA
jgi:response regulator RpfG family c-di-GMP phosphodiesterase